MSHDAVPSIDVKLSREELAAAILSYVERSGQLVIPGENVSYTMQCFVDENSEITHVEASFSKMTRTEAA